MRLGRRHRDDPFYKIRVLSRQGAEHVNSPPAASPAGTPVTGMNRNEPVGLAWQCHRELRSAYAAKGAPGRAIDNLIALLPRV